MGERRIFLCDKDLARIAECSTSTISRSANGKGGPKDRLKEIKPVIIGGARRWKIADVANAFGVSQEEILSIVY